MGLHVLRAELALLFPTNRAARWPSLAVFDLYPHERIPEELPPMIYITSQCLWEVGDEVSDHRRIVLDDTTRRPPGSYFPSDPYRKQHGDSSNLQRLLAVSCGG
ncbi:MAG TPA: hypothetical protein VN494_07645 [Patescibacteria group bacterium]|nr:hypothetical protein [Patescibacteria group bacterium]